MISTLAQPAEEDLVGDLLIQQLVDKATILASTSGYGNRIVVYPRAWFDIADVTRKILRKHYRNTFRKAVLATAKRVGVPVDVVELNRSADEWAGSTAHAIALKVTDTLKVRYEEIVAGLDPKTVSITAEYELRRLLDNDRARLIGATETTRAATAGEQWFVARFNSVADQSEKLVPLWFTAADERTCHICAPLHGTLPFDLSRYGVASTAKINGTVSGWDAMFSDGPPAHPNCRCVLQWVPVLRLIPRSMGRLKSVFAPSEMSHLSRPQMGRLRKR